MRVAPFYHAGTVVVQLQLTLHLFSVSFGDKGSDILK